MSEEPKQTMVENEPKQKFKRGSRVRFDRYKGSVEDIGVGTEAIVVGTYPQLCGNHGDWSKYQLVILDAAGEPSNRLAWVNEADLSLLSADYMAGHDLIDRDAEKRWGRSE